MSPDPTVRALEDRERAMLAHLLSAPFDGAADLLAQLPFTQVTGSWGTTVASPSIDLRVDATVRRAACSDGPVPIEANFYDESGEYVGELLVWVENGRLSALEYATIGDEAPTELPDPAQVTVTVTVV
jgi:hypothetical protein